MESMPPATVGWAVLGSMVCHAGTVPPQPTTPRVLRWAAPDTADFIGLVSAENLKRWSDAWVFTGTMSLATNRDLRDPVAAASDAARGTGLPGRGYPVRDRNVSVSFKALSKATPTPKPRINARCSSLATTFRLGRSCHDGGRSVQRFSLPPTWCSDYAMPRHATLRATCCRLSVRPRSCTALDIGQPRMNIEDFEALRALSAQPEDGEVPDVEYWAKVATQARNDRAHTGQTRASP